MIRARPQPRNSNAAASGYQEPNVTSLLPRAPCPTIRSMEHAAADERLPARIARALALRDEVLEAYLFGSHARGQARPDSDIDVAVYVDETTADEGRWGYRAELTTYLMAALDTDDVDVVVLNEAPILLYHRVLRDGIRLLSRDMRATTGRAGLALSRYFDFLPQLDKMDAARRFAAGKDRP